MNLNDGIWVKLTPEGEKNLQSYCDTHPAHDLVKVEFKREGGYVRFLLWEFAVIFGPHFWNGAPSMVDGNIVHLTNPVPKPKHEGLKAWCYQFKGDKETHYGPCWMADIPALLAHIASVYSEQHLAAGIEFWETDEKAYLKPPAPGSGVVIYTFDKQNGWKEDRKA